MSTHTQIQAEILEVSRALRESTKNLCRNLKDNPNVSGNLLKIQRERTELIDLLNTSCRQVAEVRPSCDLTTASACYNTVCGAEEYVKV